MTAFYSLLSNLTGLNMITNDQPSRSSQEDRSQVVNISNDSSINGIQETLVSIASAGRLDTENQLRESYGSEGLLQHTDLHSIEVQDSSVHSSVGGSAMMHQAIDDTATVETDYAPWEKYGLSESSDAKVQAMVLGDVIVDVCMSNTNSSARKLLDQVGNMTRQFYADLIKPFAGKTNQQLETIKSCSQEFMNLRFEFIEQFGDELSTELHEIMDDYLDEKLNGLEAEIDIVQSQFDLYSDLLKAGNTNEAEVTTQLNPQKVYHDLNQRSIQLIELNRKKNDLEVCKNTLDKVAQTGQIHQEAVGQLNNHQLKLVG